MNTSDSAIKRVYFLHNVCLNSSYDLNIVKNALGSVYDVVDDINVADICIYAGCGVRGIWVDCAINEINQALDVNKNLEIIATGCFSAIEPDKILQNVQTRQLKLMTYADIVEKYTNENFENTDLNLPQTESLDYEGDNKDKKRLTELKESMISDLQSIDIAYDLNVTDIYRESTKGFVFYNENEPVENITITRGCPYKCSYCSIPIGRGGKYISVPFGSIIKKIESALKRNVKHILLLGDEIGNYGLGTNGMDLSILLDTIFEKYDVSVSIRYIEPKPFIDHYNTIKKYCENDKIKLLYLPIQSGSNKILKLMNRTYKIDNNFIQKLTYLRTNTNVVLYTNWMVGFNGETEEDFQKTVTLVEELDCQINMVIPFSERPNTPAVSMNSKVSLKDKKNRHNRLFDIVKNIKANQFDAILKGVDELEKNNLLVKIMKAEDYFVQFD